MWCLAQLSSIIPRTQHTLASGCVWLGKEGIVDSLPALRQQTNPTHNKGLVTAGTAIQDAVGCVQVSLGCFTMNSQMKRPYDARHGFSYFCHPNQTDKPPGSLWSFSTGAEIKGHQPHLLL